MIKHRDTEAQRFFNFLNKLFYKLSVSVPQWLYFLIIFLSLPGVAFADDPSMVLVKVNSVPITLNDVEEEIDRIIPRTLFHRNVSPEKRADYRKDAMERLIDRELQFQESKAQGIKAEKKEIKNRINDIKKRFPSNEKFKDALQHSKLTIKDLEAKIEKDIIIEKLFKREVEDKIVVSDKEIKAHYENNTQKYKELEQVKLRHIMVRFDKESSQVASNKSQVTNNKDHNNSSGILPDKEKQKTRTKEEAKAMAEGLLERIKKGEDFATLAYEYSDDPYRVKGGELGYVHKGRMVPEIEVLAFGMKIGEVMGHVETEHGFYIIKIEDRKPEQQLSFDEVRDRIKKELEEKKKKERIKEWLKTMREKARIEYLQPAGP
ncbi:MAG: peptidylprolyl isomerase [Nitrospirae bacterium]|nr:peptidylprolyl isomerase [Nitrospirota bacterium]